MCVTEKGYLARGIDWMRESEGNGDSKRGKAKIAKKSEARTRLEAEKVWVGLGDDKRWGFDEDGRRGVTVRMVG